MAWNRPTETMVEGKGRGRQRNVHLKGLVVGAVVVAGAAVAWWFFPNSGGRGATRPTDSKRGLIKEVAPALPSKADKADKAAPKKIDPNARPKVVGEIVNGYKLLPNGRMHKVVGVCTVKVNQVSWPLSIFEEQTDQQIAELLLVRPGTAVVGDGSLYYEDFEKDFREALKKDIPVGPDDTDEERELKAAVNETRKELKARMEAGESLSDVMRQAHDQMRELGLYHDELQQEVENIAKDTSKQFSEKDIEELVTAANKMLEERGSEPLALTGPMIYQMRIGHLHNREKELEKEIEKEQ